MEDIVNLVVGLGFGLGVVFLVVFVFVCYFRDVNFLNFNLESSFSFF